MSEGSHATLLRALDKAKAKTRLAICGLAMAVALLFGTVVAGTTVMAQEDLSENNPVDQQHVSL